MSLPTIAIQTAMISRYRGDTTLQGLLVGSTTPLWSVFDQEGVPVSTAFPYIVLFPITSQSGTSLSFGTDAVDTFMQVSIFTQVGASGGFSQARSIAKRIYDITQMKALDLSSSGFNQYLLLFDNEQEVPQGDGITQLIAHRYRLETQG
jgi:Protein of unknown function (DUF3168)